MYVKNLEFGGIESTDYQRAWMKPDSTVYSNDSSWVSHLSLCKLYQSIHMWKNTVTLYLNKCVKTMTKNSMSKEPCEIIFNGMSTKSKLSMIEFLHHLGLDPFITSCSDETIILVDVSSLSNHGIDKKALLDFLKYKVLKDNAHTIRKDASTSVSPSKENSSCSAYLSPYDVKNAKTDLSKVACWVQTNYTFMQEDGQLNKQLKNKSEHKTGDNKIEKRSFHKRSVPCKLNSPTKECVINAGECQNKTKRKSKFSKLKKLLKTLIWKKGNNARHDSKLNIEKANNSIHIPSESTFKKDETLNELSRTQSIRIIKEVNSDDLFRKSSFLLNKKQAFLTEYNKKFAQYSPSDSSILYEQGQLSNKKQNESCRHQMAKSDRSKTTYKLSKNGKTYSGKDAFNIGDIVINSLKYIKQVVVKKPQSNSEQKNSVWCGEDRTTPSKVDSKRQASFQIPYEYNKKSINKGLSLLSVTTDYTPGCCPKTKNYFSYFSDYLVNKFIEREKRENLYS